MARRTFRRMIFSIYSHDLEDYPYYPFLAVDTDEAIKKYHSFLKKRGTICSGAELHWIGTCEAYWDRDKDSRFPSLENIQPLAFPQRVGITQNWLGHNLFRMYILGSEFVEKIRCYLEKYLQKRGF